MLHLTRPQIVLIAQPEPRNFPALEETEENRILECNLEVMGQIVGNLIEGSRGDLRSGPCWSTHGNSTLNKIARKGGLRGGVGQDGR